MLDVSETQSESAWSTDVMASDTERLIDVDNDDTGSIAQSDDTNSIAPSDDTRSETDENLTPGSRRLSSSSNSFMNQNLASNFQEMRRLEIRMEENACGKSQTSDKEKKKDGNSNVIFKPLPFSSTQNTLTYTEQQSEVKTTQSSICSFVSSRVQKTMKQLDGKDLMSANGYQKIYSMDTETNEVSLSYIKENGKYEERSNEMLLSNCSLNSSSSGSSNSLENKTNNENSEKWEHKQWMNSSQSSLNVTSTPSESTSELSVLSVTNYINPGSLLNKKAAVVGSRPGKSSSSTGAIPKSISFDISADKGDKYGGDDHRSKRGSFFGKLRMGFRNRRGKSFRNAEDLRVENEEEGASGSGCSKGQSLQVKFGNNMGKFKY